MSKMVYIVIDGLIWCLRETTPIQAFQELEEENAEQVRS